GRCIAQHPFDPKAPAVSASVPLMVGCNHDEATFFLGVKRDVQAFSLDEATLSARLAREYPGRAPRLLEVYRASRPEASPTDLYIAITTAALVWGETDVMAERKFEQHAAPVYRYLFTYQSQQKVPGTNYPRKAMHSLELNFKLDNIEQSESPF